MRGSCAPASFCSSRAPPAAVLSATLSLIHIYGVAAHGLPVAHPVDYRLAAYHDGLYKQRQKRQRRQDGHAGYDVAPVSYTHLDVYKRQDGGSGRR